MSEAVADAALALAVRLGGRSNGIVFFGGEPLLARERILWTVARARELTAAGAPPFHFKLTTNGLLLDDELCDWAAAADVQVAVSIDGVRQAHDAHRRLPDGGPSFELVAERLRALLTRRPYSSVLAVVRPDTARWLADSMVELRALGARYLIVSLDYSANWQEDDFAVLGSELGRLAELYLAWSRADEKFYLSPFEVKIASRTKGSAFGEDRCELGERQLSVDPEGHLYPCVQFVCAGPESSWRLGHVTSGIDRAAKARIRAMAAQEHEPCRQCAIRSRCHHTCGCLNWQTTGTVTSVSPVLCRYEQLLLPIADRVAETLFRERNPCFLHKHYNAAYPLLSLVEDVLGHDCAGCPNERPPS